jgi:alpha-galactosidase
MRDSRKVFSVNMPNRGVASNLPYDAVLELPAAATARGFIPVQIRDFPDNLTALLAKPLAIAELVVDAALKGDRKLYTEAILMGGYIEDRTAVTKMVDELIKAHIQYLPQFR